MARYCEKCKRTMDEKEFYGSNNLEKYPEGKLNLCKKCLTMHVDNFNPETYLWILQECDVPYIPDKWNEMIAKWGKDRSKITSTTIIGRYLSAMKLKQWRDYRWKDTEFLQEVANAKIEEAMKRQGYGAAEIAQTIATASVSIPQGILEQPIYEDEPITYDSHAAVAEDYFAQQSGGQDDFNVDLTEEDRTYLRLKWGKAYRPDEWVALEQLYQDMMESYDIQGAGHIDNLKLVCKTSLKANQLIDCGDIEGFQKMSKVYDSLMKSGKFTAAQNKAEQADFVDSVGELIEMCEKQGYIERFYTDSPKDKVDMTLEDMKRYTKTLIEEETSLPMMVEKALKEIEKEDKESAENNETEIVDDDNMSIDEIERTMKDSDYSDFNDFLEESAAADEAFLESEADL